jgi:hypothetical protein
VSKRRQGRGVGEVKWEVGDVKALELAGSW